MKDNFFLIAIGSSIFAIAPIAIGVDIFLSPTAQSQTKESVEIKGRWTGREYDPEDLSVVETKQGEVYTLPCLKANKESFFGGFSFQDAVRRFNQQIEERTFSVEVIGEDDLHNRTWAKLTDENTTLSEIMVRNGIASVANSDRCPGELGDKLQSLQETAIDEKKGLWQNEG